MNNIELNKIYLKSQKNIDNYIIKNKIGQGSYGIVYLVEKKNNKKLYALKISNDDSENEIDYSGILEINMLKICNNINIINEKDILIYKNAKYILMDYIPTTLYNYIQKNKNKNIIDKINIYLPIIYQFISVGNYLKKYNIIHRDIKPGNILVEKNKIDIIKLIDFGISTIDIKNKHTNVQTYIYRSPEIFELNKKYKKYKNKNKINNYNYKIDIWSIGCILLKFFFNKNIFVSNDEYSTFELIKYYTLKLDNNNKKTLNYYFKYNNLNNKQYNIVKLYKNNLLHFMINNIDILFNNDLYINYSSDIINSYKLIFNNIIYIIYNMLIYDQYKRIDYNELYNIYNNTLLLYKNNNLSKLNLTYNNIINQNNIIDINNTLLYNNLLYNFLYSHNITYDLSNINQFINNINNINNNNNNNIINNNNNIIIKYKLNLNLNLILDNITYYINNLFNNNINKSYDINNFILNTRLYIIKLLFIFIDKYKKIYKLNIHKYIIFLSIILFDKLLFNTYFFDSYNISYYNFDYFNDKSNLYLINILFINIICCFIISSLFFNEIDINITDIIYIINNLNYNLYSNYFNNIYFKTVINNIFYFFNYNIFYDYFFILPYIPDYNIFLLDIINFNIYKSHYFNSLYKSNISNILDIYNKIIYNNNININLFFNNTKIIDQLNNILNYNTYINNILKIFKTII